ncbi:hypothetical protein Bca4012_019153 [Brassica carinata]
MAVFLPSPSPPRSLPLFGYYSKRYPARSLLRTGDAWSRQFTPPGSSLTGRYLLAGFFSLSQNQTSAPPLRPFSFLPTTITMSRRFTAEEKGKSVVPSSAAGVRRRIRAPDLDTSALIQANALTLIGRLTNPQEQSVRDIISFLPKKWDVEGPVTGSDLGQFRFQFRLHSEKDLQSVLNNRPYHYDNWMVILERWEPVISDAFPSQIPFWINIQGLPLHFWHHSMIYEIALDLGALDTYSITSTSARMKVLVNGLNPLIKETMIDFKSGEESLLTLEYEGLKNHCSFCLRLSHLESDCPHRVEQAAAAPPAPVAPTIPVPVITQGTIPPVQTQPRSSKRDGEQHVHDRSSGSFNSHRQHAEPTAFAQRLDRNGKSFGERISLLPSTTRPLKNKITPEISEVAPKEAARLQPPAPHQRGHRSEVAERRTEQRGAWQGNSSRHRRPSPRSSNSPPGGHSHRHQELGNNRKRSREEHNRRETRNTSDSRQNTSPPYTTNRGRCAANTTRLRQEELEKQRSQSRLEEIGPAPVMEEPLTEDCEVNSHPGNVQLTTLPPRPPLERNLNLSDFTPPPPPIPSKEQVMEQLREDAHRYVNHPNPVESEARRLRVLDSNVRGEMEDTADRIIATARAASLASSPAQQIISFQPEPGFQQNAGHEISFASVNEVSEPNTQRTMRDARPPKPKRTGSTSRGLLGSKFRKHNLALSQRSPTVRPPSKDTHSRTPARSTGRRESQSKRDN